ncbi:MAG: YbaB/EbfC family nucleoid-associated protein [Planctomycetota bacterium]
MFKGLGNLGNIASMVAAFKDLPDKMQDLNARMKDEHVSGKSSCGRVSIIVNCVGEVQSVSIKETFDGPEMENAVKEAANAAGAVAKQTFAEAVRQMIAESGVDIPGVDGLLSSLTGN